MHVKLQLALDDITLEDALRLTEQTAESVDIIEVGTPMVMSYGMEAVRQMRSHFPDKEILCDCKIMDAGGYEAQLALDAGADCVTVLAVTDNRTIRDVADTAHACHGLVMADMLCVQDIPARIAALQRLGVDILGVHTGVDQQAEGRTPLEDLRLMRECAVNGKIAVAGGINVDTVRAYLQYRPEIIIVGGGICRAAHPAQAAKALKESMRSFAEKRETR
ncbi:MAG: 3-hexulose-6-phosphate synthase [Lachnospiraceae bacterium]|jgi:3-hexulose-6-phosphate synthase